LFQKINIFRDSIFDGVGDGILAVIMAQFNSINEMDCGRLWGGYGAVMGRLGWMLPLFNVEISGCFQSSWKEK